jgi:hypothetical protein
MAYIPTTTHVTLLATLRRERALPVAGEVVVQLNQRVEAAEVVAHALIADAHRLVDVARELDVPADKVAAYMLKQDGEPIKKGEPIARRKTALGLGSKTVYSPVDGYLMFVRGGKAVLAAIAKAFELRAGVPAVIATIEHEHGVVIETTGALLEGVWGNGQEAFAVMNMVGGGPAAALLSEQVDVSMRSAILAVGTLQDDAAFRRLSEMSVRGLIVGSLNSALIPAVRKLEIPVLVTDGFGAQGFSTPAYNLLVTNAGREVWVNARVWDRFAGGRPEVIVPLASPGQSPALPVDGEALATGKRVRVRRGPEAGVVGTINALSEESVRLPNGVRARVAYVESEETPGQAFTIPFANLEILE